MAKKTAAKKAARKVAATPYLLVTQPISFWEKDLKADAGGLFKSLSKAVWHLGSGSHWAISSDIGDAVAALGLKADPGGLAWWLIKRSLLRAMYALTEEAWLHRNDTLPEPKDDLEDAIDKEIGRFTLEISPDFFRRPGNLAFLPHCEAWFESWLCGRQFEKPKAASLAQRLPSYFVYALNQEWREHADLYAPIVSAATTPFTVAGERERAWEQYRAWLGQELDSPMFGEPFSLRQLFIPLRAYYTKPHSGEKESLGTALPDKEKNRVAGDLFGSLLEWVNRSDREDVVRIISGGPGSGKSSVAKMFTAKALAETQWRTLYLPLHRIRYEGDLVPAIEKHLRETQVLPGHAQPLDAATGEAQLLLVFDGLDELAMLGKVAQDTASQFVRAVKDLVRDRNASGLRLKVILTGRTVIMQSLESEFRKEGAVLHLCPYFYDKADRGEQKFERGWDILTDTDQRQEWWRKYGQLTGQGYPGLPEHLNRVDLAEVSSEPLLNYLLAIANQAKTLDFSHQVTQNQIYASLIKELYDRRWGQGEHFAIKGLTQDNFYRILEEIAVAAWHGDGRKTTVGEIKKHCQDAGIMTMLEIFQQGAEGGVLRLLTAFFFRQAGVRADENAFEFTHKSFGEYLVARRLIRMVGILEKKVEEQKREFTGWDERKCLEEWARLCGPSPMTNRQWEFVKNEMHTDRESPARWQTLIGTLVNALLRQGMPMEKLALPDFRTMVEQSRNAEECLLLALNACAAFTGVLSNIDWPETTSAGAWIKKLQGQRVGGGGSGLVMAALSNIGFPGQELVSVDLRGANLREANLRVANLSEANLSGANLSGANLSGANLRDAYLSGAYLRGADFRGADLRGADLRRADLRGADLSGASLSGADLREADLSGADLSGAYLRGADFRRADLSGADFRRADLSGADLRGADLRGASLSGADLREADLRGAYLSGAYLRGADFRRADLRGADLRGADLRGADLSGADLSGVDLSRANLSGAFLLNATGLPDDILERIDANGRYPS